MRPVFTSSTDRRPFFPFTSSLLNGDAASQSQYIRKRGEGELAVRAAFVDAILIRQAVMFGPDDAFLTTVLKLLRQLPVYPMFGRGLTRLQPAYVEDVVEAVGRTMQRAETPSMIFEFGGPRVYSYEEFLRAVAHQAGLAPRLIPVRFAVWQALAWASEVLPGPLLTRNQVELMQVDTVSSPEMPGFIELGILPQSVEAILQTMLVWVFPTIPHVAGPFIGRPFARPGAHARLLALRGTETNFRVRNCRRFHLNALDHLVLLIVVLLRR